MRKLAVALALLASGAVNAAEIPQGSDSDNRIQYVNYNASDVVVVHAKVGYVSWIVFGEEEEIALSAAGVPQGWEITPNGNVLFLKPRSVVVADDQPSVAPTPELWNTNLAVATNKHRYDIEIRLLEEGDRTANAFYRVEYRYPHQEAERRAEELRVAEQRELIEERQQARAKPRNWDFEMISNKRSRNIWPNKAYDDGTFTYLRFSNNGDFPTVFIEQPDGHESKVNTHTNPEYPDVLIVHRIAERLILRLGKGVVAVINNGFSYDVPTNHAGSTLPDMKRTVKGAGE